LYETPRRYRITRGIYIGPKDKEEEMLQNQKERAVGMWRRPAGPQALFAK
jgi:hypothetical protein